MAPGFEKYSEEASSLHEAGFDAFMTGSCFATMCKFLGMLCGYLLGQANIKMLKVVPKRFTGFKTISFHEFFVTLLIENTR